MSEREPNLEIVRHESHAGTIFRLVIAAAVVVALVVVGMDNRRDVRVGYAFGDADAPIWIVLVAAAIAGMFVAWLVRHRPGRSVE